MTDKEDNNNGTPEKPSRRTFLKKVAGVAVTAKNPNALGKIAAAADSIAPAATTVFIPITEASIINTQYLLSVLPSQDANGYKNFQEQLQNLRDGQTVEFDDLTKLLERALQQKAFYLLSDSIDAQRLEGEPSGSELLAAFSNPSDFNSQVLREAYIQEDFLSRENWLDNDDERTDEELAKDRMQETVETLKGFTSNAIPSENIDQTITEITEELAKQGHPEYEKYAENFITRINQIITKGNIEQLPNEVVGALDESLPESSMFHVVPSRIKTEESPRPPQLPSQNAKKSPNFALTAVAEGVKKTLELPLPEDGKPELVTPMVKTEESPLPSQLPSQNAKKSPNFALTPVAEGVKKTLELPLPEDGKPELVTPMVKINEVKYEERVEEKPLQLDSPNH